MSFPTFTHGLARAVSRSLERCELLHLARQPFNVELARCQHAGYVAALEAAGVAMTVLPEEPELPDSVFVEDPALILDEAVVLCRPGAASRRRETDALAPALRSLRPVFEIKEPGTLEGGDVLKAGRTLYAGLSSRTNREGIRQLEAIAEPLGYKVVAAPVTGCLHLKTAVTAPAEGLLLANAAWIDLAPFHGFEILPVPATEPWGANTLPVNGRVLIPASLTETAALLRGRGLNVISVDVSELQKAEGSVTCLSLLYGSAGKH